MRLCARVFWGAALAVVACTARADVVSIGAAADNTLFEDSLGTLSNGAGQYLFAGRTNFNVLRRGLIRFDVGAAVPAGSVIEGATLRLNMSRGSSSLAEVTLHRVMRVWGEGASDAEGEEGIGIGAAPGDATWLHTFFPNSFWNSPGGDFDPAPSSATLVNVTGLYLWNSTGMAADVQSWLDSPAGSFGWMILADETQFPTAKRFDTRESPEAGNRPLLTITYTAPGPAGAAVLVIAGIAAGGRRRRRVA